MPQLTSPAVATVRVAYEELVSFTAKIFVARGLPVARALSAAMALCYGDLTGHGSHGVTNLARLYLPLLDDTRADPTAQPEVVTDLGAAALVDSRRALGLWAASDAMDSAVERAGRHGIGLVSVRGATHFGCAGYHAARAVRDGMVGMIAANCGRQRIARPPGGQLAMLGTNPLSIAAPAGSHPPFVLDMSTTVVPTGRIRAAARLGTDIPAGWLADRHGNPVTDPAAFDRGDAHLLWLGGGSDTGVYKGFGLGLAVEVLAAVVAGAGVGPSPDALDGNAGGRGQCRDDDIGFLAVAIAPDALRPGGDFARDAQSLFATLLACPSVRADAPVRYPGWHEAEVAAVCRRDGVPLVAALYRELRELAAATGVPAPAVMGGPVVGGP